MGMLEYLWLMFFSRLSAERARRFFNRTTVTRNKRHKILRKAGIVFSGRANIKPPFQFEVGNIFFGHNAFVNANCVFLDNALITIGQNTMLGPNVTICTAQHSSQVASRKDIVAVPVTLGDNVWVGAGAVILPGVTIGDNSVIAANSVVKEAVPANCLYAGVPAVFKKRLQ